MAQGPSTDWRERIAPDEEARFARQAEKLAPVHAAMSARYGAGRLLHRKPLLAARGTLEILDGLLGEIRAAHTFVMATHNLRQGLALADQVMILAAGRVVFSHVGRLAADEFAAVYHEHVREGALV